MDDWILSYFGSPMSGAHVRRGIVFSTAKTLEELMVRPKSKEPKSKDKRNAILDAATPRIRGARSCRCPAISDIKTGWRRRGDSVYLL